MDLSWPCGALDDSRDLPDRKDQGQDAPGKRTRQRLARTDQFQGPRGSNITTRGLFHFYKELLIAEK